MSRLLFSLLLVALLPTLPAWKPKDDRLAETKKRVRERLVTFEKAAEKLEISYPLDTVGSRQAFLNARIAYKRVEWLVEAYDPVMARQLNGPPVEEVEMEDQLVIEPEGFQVIEEIIFPRLDTTRLDELQQECETISANAALLLKHPWLNELTEEHLWDAMRLEMARIATLSITGTDSPVIQHSLPEAVASLEGCEDLLKEYELSPELQTALTNAKRALHTDFNSFDRFAFITESLKPLCEILQKAQQDLGIAPVTNDSRFYRSDRWWIFDTDGFVPELFSANPEWEATPERIALGKRLFSEPMLSGDGQRSCVTCHQPNLAFTDGLPKSAVLSTHTPVSRNTPTLWNAALQSSLFMDARAASLEMQIADVLKSPAEMNGSLAMSTAALSKNKSYTDAFQRAYGGLHPPEVLHALAAYIRSLIRLDSKFDQSVRGNATLLTAAEKNGFNLFTGKAKCATCHFLPLTNGFLSPAFEHTDVEVLGVPSHPDLSKPVLDTDRGAGIIANFDVLQYAFRTPTLRNVELTAPYMHNGVFQTLEEVIEFYDRGGGVGLGLEVPNQTLASDPLHLTSQEKSDLVSFLKTLTDVPAPK